MALKTGKHDNGTKGTMEAEKQGGDSESVTASQDWPGQTSGGKYSINQTPGRERKAPTSGGGK
jgi:hypothetical protein